MVHTGHRRRANGDRGAAAVEFALVSGALLLLLFGMLQFGFVMYSQITITQAARESVRHLALNLGDAQTVATNEAEPLSLSSYDPTACPAGASQDTSATVVVKAPALLPLLFDLTVTGKASMPCGG